MQWSAELTMINVTICNEARDPGYGWIVQKMTPYVLSSTLFLYQIISLGQGKMGEELNMDEIMV